MFPFKVWNVEFFFKGLDFNVTDVLGLLKEGRGTCGTSAKIPEDEDGDQDLMYSGDLMYSRDLDNGNIWMVNFYLFFIQMVGYSYTWYHLKMKKLKFIIQMFPIFKSPLYIRSPLYIFRATSSSPHPHLHLHLQLHLLNGPEHSTCCTSAKMTGIHLARTTLVCTTTDLL